MQIYLQLTYGLDCHAGLHHNKAESTYHIHLIYSERKPLEKPDVKIASRNIFYDETGKHRRTRKEILDADGNIRPGCKDIPKGTHYDCKYFGPKVGKNNPKADVIKADNEARMEWNRTVDEARVAGIPEDEIKRIDSKIKHKQKKQEECTGIRYQAFKIKLIKEISALLIQRSSKQDELAEIVRTAGYKDVNRFMKAFEKIKSCLRSTKHRQL